eukprot:m.651509 g.651509  ORF g.651509 m.651509 type:complete len:474 (+) comp22677_c0_seq1:179-1600(+)
MCARSRNSWAGKMESSMMRIQYCLHGLAFVLYVCTVQECDGQISAPQIQSDSSTIAFAVKQGLNLSIQYFDDASVTSQTDSIATGTAISNAIEMLRAEFSNATNTLRGEFSSTVASAIANQGCTGFPPAPANGTVSTPFEPVPGAVVSFACNYLFDLVGATTATCLRNGTWAYSGGGSTTAGPTCVAVVLIGTASATPATSCRDVYADHTSYGVNVSSGAYWVRPDTTRAAQQVYCDMTIAAQDGLKGFTLCGKFDSQQAGGSRYLRQGFGRSDMQAASMSDLTTFDTATGNMASIDCRPFISGGAQWLMHMGSDIPVADSSYGMLTNNGSVRFTNILADVKNDPTNFFDINRQDVGGCAGGVAGVATYDESWTRLTSDGLGAFRGTLNGGSCKIGDGHMLCSFERIGARFSNAGTGDCEGSGHDSIYWAWNADDHGCNRALRIGTGCGVPGSEPGSQLAYPPTYRYNYMFVY